MSWQDWIIGMVDKSIVKDTTKYFFVKKKIGVSVIPQLRGMDSADPPGMSSKILSSGCSKIFIGKDSYRYHK
jgi:hypothetical protein